jgi:sporulation protein YlmC with PRC-barrel domain
VRLSELLASTVVTVDGEHLGHVRDARLVRDGPPAAGASNSFRLHALAVGPHSIGTRLGVTPGHVERPRFLRRLFGWHAVMVPWTAVRAVEPGRIVVDVRGLDLERAEGIEPVSAPPRPPAR